MWYAVYDQSSGALVSIGTSVASPLPEGLGAVPYELEPDLRMVQWDAAQRMFVPKPPPAPRGVISRQTFMDRLGDAAVVGVQLASVPAAGDTAAQAQFRAGLRAWLLRFQVVSEVDVLDPRTVAGVDALIAAGLLEASRRATVLALPTPGA